MTSGEAPLRRSLPLLRSLGPTLLAALLTIWSALALADATRDVWIRQSGDLFYEWEVGAWTPGSPPQRNLEWFLRSLEDDVPPGSVVRFSSRLAGDPARADHALYLYFWARYLWPDRSVLPWRGPDSLDGADFLVSYGEPVDHPRAEPTADKPLGHLYRVRP